MENAQKKALRLSVEALPHSEGWVSSGRHTFTRTTASVLVSMGLMERGGDTLYRITSQGMDKIKPTMRDLMLPMQRKVYECG